MILRRFPLHFFLAIVIAQTVTSQDTDGCVHNMTEMTGRVFIPESNNVINLTEDNYTLCTWLVTGPLDSVIEFDLEAVFIQGNTSRLVFGVGDQPGNSSTEYATVNPDQFSDRAKVVVPHSTAWVQLLGVTDPVDNITVVFSYKIVLRVVCDSQTLQTAPRGEITSINYPEEYPINGECTWKFDIPDGYLIQLTFYDFDLQDDSDFLLIGDGTEVLQGVFTPYTGRLQASPYVVTFGYSHVWLLFISNHLRDDRGHKGFNVTYTIVPKHSENDLPPIQTIAIPKPTGHPFVEKIQLTISGLNEEEMKGDIELFKATIAGFVRVYCKHAKSACGTQATQISPQDVKISELKEGGRSVDVELTLGPDFPANMAAVSSLHLDKLVEAKTLNQESEPIKPMHSTDDSAEEVRLPKWLIGVIAVVAFLVVVFFVLIVYSLLKDRKRSEKAQEDGRSETASDDTEAAKETPIRGNSKETSKDKAETVTEITTTTTSVSVPNGTAHAASKKTIDGDEESKTQAATSKKLVDETQKRADPEGKSDVHVIEPLQSSSATQEPETNPSPSTSASGPENVNQESPTPSPGGSSEMKNQDGEDSATTDSADDGTTPEHDLSTDL